MTVDLDATLKVNNPELTEIWNPSRLESRVFLVTPQSPQRSKGGEGNNGKMPHATPTPPATAMQPN